MRGTIRLAVATSADRSLLRSRERTDPVATMTRQPARACQLALAIRVANGGADRMNTSGSVRPDREVSDVETLSMASRMRCGINHHHSAILKPQPIGGARECAEARRVQQPANVEIESVAHHANPVAACFGFTRERRESRINGEAVRERHGLGLRDAHHPALGLGQFAAPDASVAPRREQGVALGIHAR